MGTQIFRPLNGGGFINHGFTLTQAESSKACFLEILITDPRDPGSPMNVTFIDYRAQCRYYLYSWIPTERFLCLGLGFGV